MNAIAQVLAIAVTNLRHIPQRLGSSLVIVIGIAGVVGVLIPVVAMSLAFESTMTGDGRPDRAIVIARTATAEYESNLSRGHVGKIMDAPGAGRAAAWPWVLCGLRAPQSS